MPLNKSLLPVEEAQDHILGALSAVPPEMVCLPEALGRILAGNVIANLTQPPFPASAMDGYAVKAEDVATSPAELSVVGESAAGSPWAKTLLNGQAVRIFTGAPVPEGADTVIIQENVTRLIDCQIRIDKAGHAGQHIRAQGLDFQAGQIILSAPGRLGPRDIGLAAAANCLWLSVRRKPRIGILSTGDELVPVGGQPHPAQIMNSNGPALSALIRANGGEAVDLGIAADNEASLKTLAQAATGLDMLVTIGGASVGDHDLVQKVLGDQGLIVDFWRIAMRPGKPLMFGSFNGIPMLGLPGNPVSALVCSLIFLLPAMGKLLGLEDASHMTKTALLSEDMPENGERQNYVRASLVYNNNGELEAAPLSVQDSAMQSLLAQADCLIVRPPGAAAAKAGSRATVIALNNHALII